MSSYSGRMPEYWADVKSAETRLREEASKQVLQLRGGTAVFCTSLAVNRGSNSARAGVVSEVSFRDAAKLVIDGTHRLATDSEIEAYLSEQRTKRSIASAFTAASQKSIGLGGK